MNRRIALYVLIALTVLGFTDVKYGWSDMFAAPQQPFQVEGFDRAAIPPRDPAAIHTGSLQADLAPGEMVKIRNSIGNINITGADTNEVDLSYTIRVYANDQALAEEYLSGLKLDAVSSEGGLEIDLIKPGSRPKMISRVEIDIQGSLPNTAKVDLDNSMGDVHLADIAGPSHIKNQYGDASIKGVKGNLTVHAPFGGIEIEDVNGTLVSSGNYGSTDVKNIIGDVSIDSDFCAIHAKEITGSLSVKSSYSEATVENIDGNLTSETRFSTFTGRDIIGEVKTYSTYGRIHLEYISGDMVVDTKHSDVDVILGAFDHNLSLEANQGGIILKGELAGLKPVTSGETRTLEQVLGRGTHNVQITTVLGSISVK
ncbi:MAG: hypothetical protein GX316_09835 [Firmicutes bacterium]|nr:hypothetical protein [Bacillota bacterium]